MSKRCSHLKHLSVKVSDKAAIDLIGTRSLCRSIVTNAIGLKSLNLDLSMVSESQKLDLTHLGGNLSRLLKLKELDLSLDSTETINSKSFKKLFSSLMIKECNIEKFKLNFGTISSNKDVITLSENLQNIILKLKYLSLTISACLCLDEMTFSYFCKALKARMPDLEHFHLTLSQCGSEINSGMKELGEALSFASDRLKSLSLVIPYSDLAGNALAILRNGFNDRKLPNLQSLWIDLEEIDDEGLTAIGALIGKGFKRLQKLKLGFRSYVGSMGLKVLGQNLRLFNESLQNFDVSFGDCKELTGEDVQTFAEEFDVDYPELKYFKLGIVSGSLVDDHGFLVLSKAIKRKIHTLDNLYLGFYYNGFTDEGKEKIKEVFRDYSQKLKSLEIII